MPFKTRCEAAILKDDRMLMLKVWDHTFTGRHFWVIPGGGMLPGETEEACVMREVREETHLEVEIDRLIIEAPEPTGLYKWRKTYACRITGGDALPGLEPEVDSDEKTTIQGIGWFDLRDPESWDPLAREEEITFKTLMMIRDALGYEKGEGTQ